MSKNIDARLSRLEREMDKQNNEKEKRYTPQQIEYALRRYLPSSSTFGNAYRSALKAGYSEEYAKVITTRDLRWVNELLSEIVRNSENSDTEIPTRETLVEKSKKVMIKTLDNFDSSDPNRQRLAQDSAKFVLKSDPEFSEKQDITSGGEPLEGIKIKLVDASRKGGDGEKRQKDTQETT